MTRQPFAVVTADGNVVRNDVLSDFAIKQKSEASKQIEDRFAADYSSDGLVEPLYNPDALTKLPELNVYHYRCCRTKARDTAGLGWTLAPAGEDPSEDEEATLTAFFENLSEPLEQVLDKAQFDYETVGWAAIELIRESTAEDAPYEDILHVPAHTLRVHSSGNKFQQKRGTKKVWFKRAGYDKDINARDGSEHELGSLGEEDRANEILWWMNYTTRSDFYGLPDVIPALGAVHGDVARRDYNIAFFDNYGVPSYAVWISGDFDPGEPDADGVTPLEKKIQSSFSALAKKPHSTLVLSVPTESDEGDVEIKFEPLSVDTKDASFRMYRVDNRDEVLAAHAMPPYRIGIAETGSLGGSTARESTEIYKTSVIEPRQSTLENLINSVILPVFEIETWSFEFLDIDTRSAAEDLELLGKMFEMGAATPRQIATYFSERFGLEMPSTEEEPALDAYYVGGSPITGPFAGDEAGDAVASVLQSMKEELIQAALK